MIETFAAFTNSDNFYDQKRYLDPEKAKDLLGTKAFRILKFEQRKRSDHHQILKFESGKFFLGFKMAIII